MIQSHPNTKPNETAKVNTYVRKLLCSECNRLSMHRIRLSRVRKFLGY